jgi:hypothetical protein
MVGFGEVQSPHTLETHWATFLPTLYYIASRRICDDLVSTGPIGQAATSQALPDQIPIK